ncbi:MAG TPA: hypothetical protein VMF06_21715 [Candidatus Limnocylindria bacterium]|jgi:hypothetical protein|nr:hypothetical protein [Candidatus Limnocylindria bacterium]
MTRCLFAVTWSLAGAISVEACELCAIYRASDAKGEYTSGLTLTVAEQFVRYGTEQFNGTKFHRANPDYLEQAITHVVAGWNFNEKFGLSLNLPVVHERYRFSELVGGFTRTQHDQSETGLGDLSLVGRWRIYDVSQMKWGFTANLLGGIKLPTGDPAHLDELQQSIDHYETVVGPGHNHDALGPIVSGIHLHDISLGSGSVDGILGATTTTRWDRLFLNLQAQYYLRTEGAGHYQYADALILSGGPGAFLWLQNKRTLSLALNTVYETRGSDSFRGKESGQTGLTVWYLGPQLVFTWRSNLSVLLGTDLAVQAGGPGFQNVPDFRVNAGITWRF